MVGLENHLYLLDNRPSRNYEKSTYVRQMLPNVLAALSLGWIIDYRMISEGKYTNLYGRKHFSTVVKLVWNDNNRCKDITSYRLKLENRY